MPLQSSCSQRKAPPAELQVSTVHGSSSRQLRTSPVHWTVVQPSSVHGLKSSGQMIGAVVHRKDPLAESHRSTVHALPSSHCPVQLVVQQDAGVPLAAPSSHTSPGCRTPSPQTPTDAVWTSSSRLK